MEILGIKKNNFKGITSKILSAIKKGQVIVCPTDTIYGLICDATNRGAVERIFKIKKRLKTKPLAVFVKDIKMAREYAFIDKKQEDFLKENWPGKVTVILKGKKGLPPFFYKNAGIGLRAPDNKLLKMILKKIRKPIAQTSVNISGNPALIKIKEIIAQFQGKKSQPDLIINAGNQKKSKPSKVIDLTETPFKVTRY